VAFSAPAIYPDGLTLTVQTIKQGTENGQGRGIFPGSPTTSFALHLTNGTAGSIDLARSVVTVTYGNPARVAQASYASGAQDLTGTLTRGQSADAVYVFSIPPGQLDNVKLTVDIGGAHAAALFSGSAKGR
jgi:hypothetical protein